MIEDERHALKRQRKQEIISMQRLDTVTVISRNTWYFLGINSCQQMLYSLKRINEPLREHIGNSFQPLPTQYHNHFLEMRNNVVSLYQRALNMLSTGNFTNAEQLRKEGETLQLSIAEDRKQALDSIHSGTKNLNTLFLRIHIMQESQELIGCLRHMIRGMNKFAGGEG